MNDNDIELILEFAHHLEGQRHPQDPTIINDRDRWFVTLIFSILSDPKHRLNKTMMRDLMRTYKERGGHLPFRGQLQKEIRERDQFDHIIQYLYDDGYSMSKIAMLMGCNPMTVFQHLKYLREDDQEAKELSNE